MRKINWILIVVLLFSVFFRLWLTDKGWHIDMLSNAGWGEWIFNNGPQKFYENSIWTYAWPTQPPLVNSTYAFNKNMYIELLGRAAWLEYHMNKLLPGEKVFWLSDFVQWFGYGNVNTEIPFQIGYLVTMKLLPIMADILIGVIIYEISGKKTLYTALYLLSPFSWYLSALWGQYDQVGFLLALFGFLSIGKKWELTAPSFLTLAILMKPTSLILVPFFSFWYLFRGNNHKGLKIAGLLIPFVLFWYTTAPYTHKNPFEFARYDLTRIIFEKSEPRVTVNAFNFWRIFIGDAAKNPYDKILFIPILYWGWLSFVFFNYLAIRKNNLWEGLFLVSAGAWIFMTGMLERYFFAGIVFGLFTIIKYPKLLKYWVVLSIIFWMNMYYHWWIPSQFSILKNILLWQDSFITRGLSILTTGLFLIMVLTIFRLPKLIPGHFRKEPDHSVVKPKVADGI